MISRNFHSLWRSPRPPRPVAAEALRPVCGGPAAALLSVALPAAVLLTAMCVPAAGEVFVLANGGRVEGTLLNADELMSEKYVIEVSPDVRVTLNRSQVSEVLRLRPEEEEYERIRATFADTAAGQWEAAEWCRQKRLSQQRDAHLERVIELEPDHAEARRALGYGKSNGRWVTQEEVMVRRGLKYYKGRWRTSQEIELMETQRKTEVAEKEWAQKIARWRKWLGSDRDVTARRSLLEIDDPLATAALIRALDTDEVEQVRLLYVEALANVGTPEAIRALAACSLFDPAEEVRLTCLDHLKKQKRPEVVAYYVGELRSKDNRIVNLAASGLSHMRDPSATGPLIDALVTTHRFKIVPRNPGSTSATFGSGPGAPGGLSVGGGPKIVERRLTNRSVLDALVAITGQNFNFDQQAWKYWYASQRRRKAIDMRRD